jgi:hypothetical protein
VRRRKVFQVQPVAIPQDYDGVLMTIAFRYDERRIGNPATCPFLICPWEGCERHPYQDVSQQRYHERKPIVTFHRDRADAELQQYDCEAGYGDSIGRGHALLPMLRCIDGNTQTHRWWFGGLFTTADSPAAPGLARPSPSISNSRASSVPRPSWCSRGLGHSLR